MLEQLAADLGDLAITIEVTDAAANVVARVSEEHHGDREATDVAYVTTPIGDPRRDAPVGALGITCARADAGAFVLPYAQLAARTIADRMLDGAALADRTLLEHFLRARRRARGALVGVNDREILTNGAAARLVRGDDHSRVWKFAMSLLAANEPSTRELRLRAETVTAHCEPVLVGAEAVGALIYLDEVAAASTTDPSARTRTPRRSTFGWESLRSSELGIAELVAEGLTNREVAARLFVSPHTVDFHLRQIFRKLSIASRIELTRLVIEHRATVAADPADPPAFRTAS